MKILIDINDSIVRDILNYSDEYEDNLQIEEVILSLLNEALDNKKTKTLNDEDLDDVINKMISFAIENKEKNKTFKTNELYKKAIDEPWVKLSPSTRKSLGRRFRSAINEYWDKIPEGDFVIEFKDRNINNAAIYKVVKKVGL